MARRRIEPLDTCFHPLKAGRRPLSTPLVFGEYCAFPSPQGGSETSSNISPTTLTNLFPSPQGGSETTGRSLWTNCIRRFPSPQGGSETHELVEWFLCWLRFHPLKAGRRPISQPQLYNSHFGFHPLKAGRRLWRTVFNEALKRFPSPQGGSETYLENV